MAAAVVAVVLVLVAAGSGVAVAVARTGADHRNADDQVGGRRAVAVVVDRLEEASMETICAEVVSAAYRERLGGEGCVEAVGLDDDGRAEIDITSITIDGDTAVAVARERDAEVRIALVREGGSWRIDQII